MRKQLQICADLPTAVCGRAFFYTASRIIRNIVPAATGLVAEFAKTARVAFLAPWGWGGRAR